MSTLLTASHPVPLTRHEGGVIRVAGTRVTLDTVLAAFEEGATAEEIVQQYPALPLADVYAVISHCLKNRTAVEAYLAERAPAVQAAPVDNPLRLEARGLRARLLARRKA